MLKDMSIGESGFYIDDYLSYEGVNCDMIEIPSSVAFAWLNEIELNAISNKQFICVDNGAHADIFVYKHDDVYFLYMVKPVNGN